MLCLGDAEYPAALAEIADAPPVLWTKGRAELMGQPMLALVGTRNASALGTRMARSLAADLGAAGHVVVSGLARGIDALAHRAALDTGTIAVMAGGLDVVYPPENTDLARDIGEKGLVLSEMPFGLEPQARHFPRRNRIVAGLARAVIVVEAAVRSGSLITARMAGEQGREVFAVPGSPLDPRAEGTNGLLKQGAIMVTEAADVIEALAPILGRGLDAPAREPELEPADPPDVEPAEDERARIVSLLGPSPASLDDLVRLSGAKPAIVRTVLLELEIAGRLERHGGGLVSLL
jgi:DNA processing protein